MRFRNGRKSSELQHKKGFSNTQKFIAASQSDYFFLFFNVHGLFFTRASLFSCRVVIAQLQLDADVLPVRYFIFTIIVGRFLETEGH